MWQGQIVVVVVVVVIVVKEPARQLVRPSRRAQRSRARIGSARLPLADFRWQLTVKNFQARQDIAATNSTNFCTTPPHNARTRTAISNLRHLEALDRRMSIRNRANLAGFGQLYPRLPITTSTTTTTPFDISA